MVEVNLLNGAHIMKIHGSLRRRLFVVATMFTAASSMGGRERV